MVGALVQSAAGTAVVKAIARATHPFLAFKLQSGCAGPAPARAAGERAPARRRGGGRDPGDVGRPGSAAAPRRDQGALTVFVRTPNLLVQRSAVRAPTKRSMPLLTHHHSATTTKSQEALAQAQSREARLQAALKQQEQDLQRHRELAQKSAAKTEGLEQRLADLQAQAGELLPGEWGWGDRRLWRV